MLPDHPNCFSMRIWQQASREYCVIYDLRGAACLEHSRAARALGGAAIAFMPSPTSRYSATAYLSPLSSPRHYYCCHRHLCFANLLLLLSPPPLEKVARPYPEHTAVHSDSRREVLHAPECLAEDECSGIMCVEPISNCRVKYPHAPSLRLLIFTKSSSRS